MKSIISRKPKIKGFFGTSVKPLLVILFLIQTFFLPKSVKSGDVGGLGGYFATIGLGVIISVPAGGGGLTSIVANSIYITNDKKIPPSWKWIGYTFSGLNIGALCYWQAVANNDVEYESFSRKLVPIHAVIAILDLGLTVWASRTPGNTEQKLSIQPKIMYDSKHQPIAGISIRFLEW